MSLPYAMVIGDPIAHSKSPLIHTFWLERAGLNAEYGLQRVEPDGLNDFLNQCRADAKWRGCNVTMPHKPAIAKLMDQLDPLAERIGAVNTVVRANDGGLVGYNTDVAGFLQPLRPVMRHAHLFRMARIIGTGGAARALVAALVEHGFTIVLAGRNTDKARAILDELAPGGEHHTPPLEHFADPTDFAFDDRDNCLDLIINASPLGMRGQAPLAFDWSHAPPGAIAYDIVTDPIETPFLRDARAAGHQTLDGLSMLIGQAAAAFEKFFGVAPDRSADAELREILLT